MARYHYEGGTSWSFEHWFRHTDLEDLGIWLHLKNLMALNEELHLPAIARTRQLYVASLVDVGLCVLHIYLANVTRVGGRAFSHPMDTNARGAPLGYKRCQAGCVRGRCLCADSGSFRPRWYSHCSCCCRRYCIRCRQYLDSCFESWWVLVS